MLFNSYEFIFAFLPCVICVFILCQRVKNKTLTSVWLVLCSLLFYGWWNPSYLPLILLSILTNYVLAKKIHDLTRTNQLKYSKLALFIGIFLNLLLLGYFKYANFFIENITFIIDKELSTLNIILPLAISFFTFQQITYLVDTHKKNVQSHTLLDYLLFVTFFPQLIAGPIVHHKEMMPQFSSPNFLKTDPSKIARGLSIFSLGLFKKVVIADYFALLANPVFNQATVDNISNATVAWTGAIGYTLQLYFDFSGYSDMAIGLALIFGIILPYNFNSPYKAKSIIDFWRRWHMTLSRFLKDYIYIPLGGNKKGIGRRFLNILATMFLGGLWHGAGWTFVIWGVLHGFFLIINHAWRAITAEIKIKTILSNTLISSLGVLLTFIVVVVAWVVFRSENLPTAINIITQMFTISPDNQIYSTKNIISLIAGLLIVWFAPNSNEIFSKDISHKPSLLAYRWSNSTISAVMFSVIGFIAVLYLARAQEFLYFQF
jgi:alginate O-acetyltransferase complex protein AlgI